MSRLADIDQFLHGSPWGNRFDDDTRALAPRLAGKVRRLSVVSRGGEGLRLRAEVEGFECEVEAWRTEGGWDFESSCSCESGYFCAHAAALLLKAGKSAPAAAPPPLRRAAELLPPEPEEGGDFLHLPPSFELHIRRQAPDERLSRVLAHYGWQADDGLVVAHARVRYDWFDAPLGAAVPFWRSEARGPDGTTVTVVHSRSGEMEAGRRLGALGLHAVGRHLPGIPGGHGGRGPRDSGRADWWLPEPQQPDAGLYWFRFRAEFAPALERDGWKILFEDGARYESIEAPVETWEADVEKAEGGWFDLSVGFDVGGKRHDLLPVLAGLLRSGLLHEPPDPGVPWIYAPLSGGKALRLPADRVRTILRHLTALLDPRRFAGRARIHPLDAATLAELPELTLQAPEEISALAAKLRDFSGVEPVAPAAGLHATLRDYQLSGFRWMRFLADHGLHGVLADDMGLGKTLQTLTHILTEKESGRSAGKPALVVAPTSVVPNWRAEAARFAPSLRVLTLSGPQRASYFPSIPHADLVLTSYALLQRDVAALAETDFHLVALDEAQFIKNPRAKVSQAACRLRAAHRLCLSGTPVENHLGELWSQMRFLIPGFLGSEESFRVNYRTPIEKDGDEERNAALKRRVAPLILRRTKDQVAPELPPKTELVHLVELHTSQKDLYETVRALMDRRVRQALASTGMGESRIVFLDALLKLRQICCHPALLPPDLARGAGRSAKLDFLVDLLELLLEEGRRILLFSQFTSMLALIAEHLDRAGVVYLQLTGASRDRAALVNAFQSGAAPLFLISLKAGGTGLNLTAADTVIHFDPWWNPAAENQASDRAHRIGQQKPVFIHKLICQDTVEERIHALQHRKSKVAEGILSPLGPGSKLDPELVRELLAP